MGLDYALVLENLQVNLAGHRCALLTDRHSVHKSSLLYKRINLKMGKGLKKEFSQPKVNNRKGQEADIHQPQYRCHTSWGREVWREGNGILTFKKTQANRDKFDLMSTGICYRIMVPIVMLITCRPN